MIETLRRATNSWLAKGLLGLIVISFAVWGVGESITAPAATTVAEIGDEPISVNEFSRTLNNEARALRLGGGLETLRALQVDRIVLSQIAARKALGIEARSLGLDASDADVATALRDAGAFSDIGGRFSVEAYERFLAQEGRNKREFEEEIRDRLAGGMVIEAISGGARAPTAAAEALWLRRNETRNTAHIVIPESAAPEPDAPDDATLRAFHEEEAELFTAPEYRALRVLAIQASALADLEAVTEADIEERYRAARADYVRPERRNLEQLTFLDEDAAREAASRVAAGETFATLAEERGLGDADIALGYTSEEEFAVFQPEAAEAAFAVALTDGEGIAGPLETPTGWTLIRVAGVIEGAETPLEDVRDTIAEDIAIEDARRALPDIANTVEDRRAEGLVFAEIAEAEPAATVYEMTVDQTGRDENGDLAALFIAEPVLARAAIERAFTLLQGDEMDLAETPDFDFFAVEVDGIEDPRLRDFETVEAEVREAWLAAARRDALGAKAAEIVETLRADIAGGVDPVEALTTAGAPFEAAPVISEGLLRQSGAPDLPQTITTALFEAAGPLAPEAVADAPAAGGGARVIAALTAVTVPDVTSETAQREIETLTTQSAAAITGDLQGLFQAALVDELGLAVNEQALELIMTGGLYGQGGHGGM